MSRRLGMLLGLAAFLVSACDRRGYVAITVKLGTLVGRVDRLELQAFDARGDAGPVLIPAAGADPDGVPDNSILAVATPIGNSLTVVVNGLGADGGSLGVGSATIASATANTQVSITIAVPCLGPRDCDPDPVCLGAEACILGTCQSTALPFADAGAACGPSDGGRCDGEGTCLLPNCGTGLHPLPPDEQCDEGVALNGNLPDHCRADCHLPSCGDGVIDPDAGEICDLDAGHNGRGLGCNATCNLFGAVTLLAGNGSAVSSDGFGEDAGFYGPGALAVIGSGLYVADTLSHLIRRIDLTSGEVTTIAGGLDGGPCQDSNGQGSMASFCFVDSMLAYNGGLIVGDMSALRLVSVAGEVTSFAGLLPDGLGNVNVVTPGPLKTASYGRPLGLASVPPDIYSSTAYAGEVLATDLITQRVSVLAAPFKASQGGGLTAVGRLLFADNTYAGVVVALDPESDGGAMEPVVAGLLAPHGLCTDGQSVYVAEFGGQQVDQIALDGGSGTLSLLAGAGSGVDGGDFFEGPEACVYDPIGRALYVSDLRSNLIFAIH
jgi:hypothetical protein